MKLKIAKKGEVVLILLKYFRAQVEKLSRDILLQKLNSTKIQVPINSQLEFFIQRMNNDSDNTIDNPREHCILMTL